MHKLSDNPPKNLRGKCSEGSSWGERRDLPTTRVPIPVLGLYPIRTNVTVKRKVRRAVILPCRSRPAPVNFPHELGPLGTPLFFFFFSVCRISLGDGPSPYGRLLAVAPPPALGPSRKFEKTSTVPPPTGRAVSPGGVLAAPAHPNSGRTNFTVKRKVRRAVIFTVPVPASSGEFSPRARATRHPLFFFFFFPRLSDLSRRLAVSLRPPSRCGPAARTWAFLKNRKNFHRAAADRAGRLSRGCSGRTRSPQLRPYKFHRETQSPAGRHFYRAGPGQLR